MMKKRFISFFLFAVLTLSLSFSASALDTSESFYVADYANIFSQDVENGIIDLNGELEHYCDNAQIVVATIDYFGNTYADEYAVQLFNDWNVSGNGMLLVVSPIEKRGGLTCGSDISNKFSSKDMENYLNKYFWDDFDRGNYDTAVTSLMSALVGWYEDEYDVSIEYAHRTENKSSAKNYEFIADVIVFLIVAAFFIISAINSSRRRWRAYHSHMGMPIPPYRLWYMFSGPHMRWHYPANHHTRHGGSFFNNRSGFGGSSGSSSFRGFSGRGFGGGGRSGGGFGGRR